MTEPHVVMTELPLKVAQRLRDENEALRRAIGGFRWLGNNLHNAGTPQFADYYRAALDDAQKAMGDDWEPLRLDEEPHDA